MKRNNLLVYIGSFVLAVVLVVTACVYSFRGDSKNVARNDKKQNNEVARDVEKPKTDHPEVAKEELQLPEEESVSETTEEKTDDIEGAPEEEEAEDVSVTQFNFHGGSILEWPVEGNVIINYDMEHMVYFSTMDEYRYSNAIAIEAQEDTDVKAAAAGEVIKVEETMDHGWTVTMQIGPEYEITYGQLKNCDLKVGDTVRRGEFFAKIAQVTSSYANEGEHLYLELTRDGEYENPLSYLDFSE